MALPVNIVTTLPTVKRFFLPLLNLIGTKNEFRIIVTSPDYVEFRFLFGLITYEAGEKKEFVIRGTDAFIDAVMSSLKSEGLDVNIKYC